MRIRKIIIPITMLALAVLIYSVAKAYRPVYELKVLKTTILSGSIAWDGQHMWFTSGSAANFHEISNIDLETGNILASFRVPYSTLIMGLTWDGQAVLIASRNGVQRYLPSGELVATYMYPSEINDFDVTSIEYDSSSEGGPYIWLSTRHSIYKLTPTAEMLIVNQIDVTKMGIYLIEMEWDGQNLLLSGGNYVPSTGYPPPSPYESSFPQILKYDPVTRTILEEYVLPEGVEFLDQMEWADDAPNGPILFGEYGSSYPGLLYYFTLGTEPWNLTYFPLMRKYPEPTITPTPTRTVTP